MLVFSDFHYWKSNFKIVVLNDACLGRIFFYFLESYFAMKDWRKYHADAFDLNFQKRPF